VLGRHAEQPGELATKQALLRERIPRRTKVRGGFDMSLPEPPSPTRFAVPFGKVWRQERTSGEAEESAESLLTTLRGLFP
jgi:hypothetical protein